MFKRTSLVAVLIGAFAFTALPSAEVEAAGYKSGRSSSSSFRSSGSRSSYSSSNRSSYSSPRATAPRSTPYNKKPATVSRPSPYTRPNSSMRANDSSYRGQSVANGYRKPVQGMRSSATPYGGRPSGHKPRQVSSPLSRSGGYAPRNTTVINRNYYGGSSYNRGFGGYNRGHYGGGYGGGMMGGSPGLGSMLLAGAGGAIVGNMLYNSFSHTPSGGNQTRTTDTITQVQADEIRQEQRIEDKLDQVNDKLDAQQAQPVAMAGPQGYSLPPDAPLMMSPDFYKLGGQM